MKIVRLHYFDTFEIIQGHRRFTKIGFEAEMDDEFEDVRDVFYKLKRKSEELFYEAKGAAEKQRLEQTVYSQPPSAKTQEVIIDGINSCTELKVLESYALIAKNYPNIKAAYDNKLKELQ